jgi:precorrin-6B methylase 2
VFTESTDHVVVVSALARLARCGGWDRMLQGKPLETELDLLDAELLVRAGVLSRAEDGTLTPVSLHPWCYDPAALAAGTTSVLRQALQYAEGTAEGWSGFDEETLLAQGEASACTAAVVAESVLPRMPEAEAAFAAGTGRLLDVGTGVGSFAITLCQLHPLARATGIDVLPAVVATAARRVAAAGLTERIELREESVDALTEDAAYDLAWIPQAFIPSAQYGAGLETVHRALRPGGWLVTLVAASRRSTELQSAVLAHDSCLAGGGVADVDAVVTRLREVGYDRVAELDSGDQTLVIGRRPPRSTPPGGPGTGARP